MVLVDLFFHYGGDWVRSPAVSYSSRMLHKWPGYDSDCLSYIDLVNEYVIALGLIGVQQLIVTVPSGKYYEIEGDGGIRALLELVNDDFNAIDLFVVEEHEPGVDVPNILNHNENSLPELGDGVDSDGSLSDDEEGIGSDSDSDFDLEELESLAAQKNRKITEKLNDYKELDKNMSFKDIPEAREAINMYALATGYGLIQLKSDKKRLRYRCDVGCPFVCLISRDGKGPGVKMKTLNTEHNCEPVFDNKRVNSKTIAQYFKAKLQDTPKYKVKDMKQDLYREFNINVSVSKCKRAKTMILEILEGSFTDDYKKIEAYAHELRLSNPGSDVVINCSKDAKEEGSDVFQKMYICFNALKQGFKAGLRPFIGLDGTFLKGKAKGILLVAVGQDSMNHFYPLAWAIVDKETKLTWRWFMSLLQDSLELSDGTGYTFISDMQKGLIDAIKFILPGANHRYYVKHIEANFCKRWKAEVVKKYLWWCAWSTYVEDFEDQLTKLGELEEAAAKDLVGYPVQSWCRAYFDTICKNNSVDNNLTESFNAWVLEPRHKPIIRMLEDIRVKVMTMLREHEKEAMAWKHQFSPTVMKLYGQYMKIAQTCKAVFNGDHGFEVTEGRDTHTVNMEAKQCTCRSWDLSGIPCPHVIKALLYLKINPMAEIHWWYSKEATLLAYKPKLQPVRGEKFWKKDGIRAIEPPVLVNMAGRPRVKRTRDKDEAINRQAGWTASRKGRTMTCSTCGQPNHNSRGCGKQTRRKQAMKGKKPAKKQRHLGDESDEVEAGRSHSPPPDVPVVDELVEIELTAPLPSQASSSSQASGLRFMPTPSVRVQQLQSPLPPEFEYENINDEVPDPFPPPIRPRTVSESVTRLQMREKQIPTGTRSIGFRGDRQTGVTIPSNLPFEPKKLQWNGRAAVTTNQLERLCKLKSKKGNGKSQQ